ncbi:MULTISPECIES: GIY-YIG nuclease family protein [unclassified Fusibacter]|uniref:GIY-YIG nuclease family protein n=1 Tax=unclassified Fusibacter TaxID=2624464 RepID=UPI001011ACCE|nr:MULTISPECIES: GIY-YIG nuclease family protein [unclassified Fusibacter]MCK8058402.1 GIY-YIG nuclease family protein [Fusibacter sp. A2]NPE23873.1 GIY-YIG nuclease family protein [Fusibacter sp. A1]RXV58524.1 GIY-YIG nuclease family protein [Fusibacter sp. A1]
MIQLNDILKLSDEDLNRTKIRFNKRTDGFDPIELFKAGDKKLYDGQFWNFSKTKSFKVGQLAIGLIRIFDDKWLLFDISEITKDLDRLNDVGYEYETLEQYKGYYGRLIVKYKNKSQNMIRNAASVIQDCSVYEILPEYFNDDFFPGYENINLTWYELKNIIDKKDWKAALENQKGVYLITDTSNNKRYVGSAYGEHMILGRWKDYVQTLHGGNKKLKELDQEYIKHNFRYSLLEIYKSTTEDKIIINREHYWMNVLLSRNDDFGYNN